MSDVDESTPLIKTKKEKKSILEVKEPVGEPKETVNKKQRTIKQLEAFEKARVKRLDNLSKQKEEKLQELGKQYLESKKQFRLQSGAGVKGGRGAPSPLPESDSEDELDNYACGRGARGGVSPSNYEESSSSEEEIIIKRKLKPKAKHNSACGRGGVKGGRGAPLPKKKRIVYISDSTSESESESEDDYKPPVVVNRGKPKPSKPTRHSENTYDFFA